MTLEQLKNLPLYIDGSDGSLWASREIWDDLLADLSKAERRYIRVSDLLALLAGLPKE